MKPRVTVGIPVYNEEAFIGETLRSALAQTEPCAIMVSDNASTDRTRAIAALHLISPSFGAGVPWGGSRLAHRLDSHNANRGAFQNFHFVVSECETPFFCLLGGHDLLAPDFIARALSCFDKRESLALVYAQTRLIDRDGAEITTERPFVGCTPRTDDVDTCGLGDVAGPLKVAANEHNAHAFNGLFRTEVLRSSTFYRVAGGDHLMVYQAALQGGIHLLEDVATKFRIVREETFPEALERWERTFGLAFDRAEPHRKMCEAYLAITRNGRMDEGRKTQLLKGLFPILKARFGYEESEGEFR